MPFSDVPQNVSWALGEGCMKAMARRRRLVLTENDADALIRVVFDRHL